MVSRKIHTQILGLIAVILIWLMIGVPVAQASDNVLKVGSDGEYDSIQPAIDDANSGDTVLIGNGDYYEQIEIYTPNLTIKSKNGPSQTSVGKRRASLADEQIRIEAQNVTVRGLAVTRGDNAIEVSGVSNTRIVKNKFVDQDYAVIIMGDDDTATGNHIIKNNVFNKNTWSDISIWYSNNNQITHNVLRGEKVRGALSLRNSDNNNIYMNAFIDTEEQINLRPSSNNTWESPKEVYKYNGERMTGTLGNYWSDYTGTDNNGDGVGEESYRINGEIQSSSPLVEQIGEYRYNIQKPQARIGNRTTARGEMITFDGSGSTDPDDERLDYSWELRDSPEQANYEVQDMGTVTPEIQFDTSGRYTLELTVTNEEGYSDSEMAKVTVKSPPEVELNVTTDNPTVGEPVQFDAGNSVASTGTIETYHWDFDTDGTIDATSQTARVNHTYDQPGNHTASVTVVDSNGFNATATIDVKIVRDGPAKPTGIDIKSPTNDSSVRISKPTQRIIVNTTVTYNQYLGAVPSKIGRRFITRINETGHKTKVQDSELLNESAIDVTLSVNVSEIEPGWHDIQVTLTHDPVCESNGSGPNLCPTVIRAKKDTARDAIGYRLNADKNKDPTAYFSYAPRYPTTGDKLVVSGFKSKDPDGSIASYEWRFDGVTTSDSVWGVDSGWFAVTQFEKAGNHTVSLTVTDDDGATDIIEKRISVTGGERSRAKIGNTVVSISSIERCGLTCRDVTYTIKNPTDESIRNVDSEVKLTSASQTLWTGNSNVGDIASGQKASVSSKIKLGLDTASTIQENDGEVTISVTIDSAEQTNTKSFQREIQS